MKVSAIISSLALLGTGLSASLPIRDTEANLPGLDATQSKNARGVLSEVTKEKVGRQGCLATMATCLVESSMLIYANSNVPESLKYPHDAVGNNYDSVGMFQQRAVYYKNIKGDMTPSTSAGYFIAKMKGIKGWQTKDVGTLCQDVQGSAYPDRYSQRVPDAKKICDAAGFK